MSHDRRPDPTRVPDEAEGAQHVPDATRPPSGDPRRHDRDPDPDPAQLPGGDDAAQGRDRDDGGWGDRGIGGGRAGGTGL